MNLNFDSNIEILKSKKTDTTVSSLITKEDGDFYIGGYPDDEGISLNGGKVGAKEAPNSIRSILYKMTVKDSLKSLTDLGNLSFNGSSLEERHDFIAGKITNILKDKKKYIGLGGGHDYGYADGLGFLKAVSSKEQKNKPLIINFDAHFDLRNLDKGITSGTPFYRLCESEFEFDLFEIGIQEHCNDQSLFEYAKTKNINTLNLEDLYSYKGFNFSYFVESFNKNTVAGTPCYISVDIDGFSSAFAPGCSQSWPSGFDYKSFEMMFNYLLDRFDVRILGLYEVSPPLDLNHMTSRLASLIAYRYLFHA